MYCPAPFKQLNVDQTGLITPCCYWKRDESRNIDWNLLRKKMIKNELIENCQVCYDREKINILSLRQELNEFYGEDKKIELKGLEVMLSNICNFKCVTCNSTYSSRWNNKEIITSHEFIKKIKTDYLEKIVFAGGEPFLDVNNLYLLESIKNIQNLVVYLTTNNSKVPDERWQKSFKKCKMVNICISVDGIEEVGEFVRLGMNFERYSKNLNFWKNSFYNVKFNFVLHSLNVLNLQKTFDWHLKNFPNAVYKNEYKFDVNILNSPNCLSLKYLPDRTKDLIRDKIKNQYFKKIIEEALIGKFNKNVCRELIEYVWKLESDFKKLPSESSIIINSISESLRKDFS